jgi:hypothetical protein
MQQSSRHLHREAAGKSSAKSEVQALAGLAADPHGVRRTNGTDLERPRSESMTSAETRGSHV